MAQPATETERTELHRVISPKLLLFFIVGDILGTGIYALTGKVAGEVGGAMWTSFLLAFTTALFTAASYLELVGKYPRAAGAALYTHRAFGIHFLTFLVAFAVMSSGLTSASTAARAFGGDYLKEFVTLPTVAVAMCFIILVAAINYRGVSESVKANVVLTTIELTGLLLVIGIGVWAVLNGEGDASRLNDFKGGEAVPALITSGAALAFFAFIGFEDSVNMAEETQEPNRVFPKVMFIGMAFTGTIYLIVALLAPMLIPVDTLAKSTAPLNEIIEVGAPDFPLWVFSLIALFAVVNSALINMMMASRLLYGMANEGVLMKVFARVAPLRRTPWVAIVFTTVLALALVTSSEISELAGTTALLLLCVFTVVNIAVLVLRREKVEHKHYRAPTILPILGLITSAYLASPFSGRETSQYKTAGILLIIGIALYGVNRIFHRQPKPTDEEPASKKELPKDDDAGGSNELPDAAEDDNGVAATDNVPSQPDSSSEKDSPVA
ncbi:MAG: APC family permease [Corynebacteriales bacterium]|nr:APC family permease [Mycobacteriales bacterium]